MDGRPDYARAIGLYAWAVNAGHGEASRRLKSLLTYRYLIWASEAPVASYRPEFTWTSSKHAWMRVVRSALAAWALRKAEAARAELIMTRLEGYPNLDRAAAAKRSAKTWYGIAMQCSRCTDPAALYGYARYWEFDVLDKDLPFGPPDRCERTIEWCLNAARFGHVEASYHAAYLRDEGFGLKQDPLEAIRWYAVAAEAGYSDARERLVRLVDTHLYANKVTPRLPA